MNVSAIGLLLTVAMQSSTGGVATTERPHALLAFEEARKSIVSGRIEWSVLLKGDEDQAWNYVSRYARNGDAIFENRGNQDGWTIMNYGAKSGVSKMPQVHMRNADGFWSYRETGTSCQWSTDLEKMPLWKLSWKDIRGNGLFISPRTMEYDLGFRAVWDNPIHKIRSWEQIPENDCYLVIGTTEQGAKFTWRINPQKGWNAERITYEMDSVTQEAICTLKQYGDTWLPEETDYFTDGQLVETVRINSGAVNQPEDPQRFTLADMGVEPGTHMAPQHLPPETVKTCIWNGENISPVDEWLADVRAGKRQWGPTFRKMHERGYYDSPYLTPEQRLETKFGINPVQIRYALNMHEGPWESYVRAFIDRYQLDEDQTAKAMKILTDCQQRARKIVERLRPELTELSSQLVQAGENEDRKRIAELNKRLDKLRAPINQIFNESLLPRLEKIPTREQRVAAEQRQAESQPAGPEKP